MLRLFESVSDLYGGGEVLRRRRFGVIEVTGQQAWQIRLRPFPKLMLLPELWIGNWYHRRRAADRCLVYYNQPCRFPNYLAITYVLSARNTTLATVHRAMDILDEVARIKGTDALLCDVINWRLSRAILARLGWEPHCPTRWHRHYIRRFYGAYPPRPAWISASGA